MYSKIIINLLLIFILAGVQFSFISGLPGWLNNFNLVLVVLIFILGLGSLKLSLWWAIGSGLMLDIFSFLPFGIFLVSLSLTLAIANFLLRNYFTNRSLYSFFALTFFSTLFYAFVLNIIYYFTQIFGPGASFFILNVKFWADLAAQIILSLIAVIIIFYFVNFFSNRLKPAFLIK